MKKTTHTTQSKMKWMSKCFILEYQNMHDTHTHTQTRQMKTKLQRDQQIQSVYTFTTNMYNRNNYLPNVWYACDIQVFDERARALTHTQANEHTLANSKHMSMSNIVYSIESLNWLSENRNYHSHDLYKSQARQAHQYFRFHFVRVCAMRLGDAVFFFTNNIPILLCFSSVRFLY